MAGGRFRQSLSVSVRAYKRAVRKLTIDTLDGVRVFTAQEVNRQPGGWKSITKDRDGCEFS